MRQFTVSFLGLMLLSATLPTLAQAPKPTAAAPAPVPRAVVLNERLESPWGIAFLPDGRILVTQKRGSMALLSADGRRLEATIEVPTPVVSKGQGGLLGLALDPDFARDPWVYWAYSEAGSGVDEDKAGTAIARARLRGTTLTDLQVIYRQTPKVTGAGHFGSRIVFLSDKTMFVTLGERQKQPPAQDLDATLGKVIRLNRDGSVPAGNPGISKTRPEIWSLGHRNPQSAALRPGTNELWVVEHGPQGGDELNRVLPGRNYGWPIVSYGCPYGAPKGDACRIGGGTHAPRFEEPVSTWVPVSIGPSGLTFYSGRRFPQWSGDAFIGALAGTALWRVRLDGNAEASRERLFGDPGGRIRDVVEGPDGWLYLVTEAGKLIQIRD